MKKHNRALRFFSFNLRFLIVLILISVLSMGCGGGGDAGGDDGGSDDGVSYSGVTTPAVIDESNAHDMATKTFTGFMDSEAAPKTVMLGATATGAEDEAGRCTILGVSQALENFLREIDWTSQADGNDFTAFYHKSKIVYGDCGGSVSFDISVNDQTGDFSGSAIYNDYCSDGVTTSGTVNISGQVDLLDYELLRYSFSFKDISVSSGGDIFTYNGEISLDCTGPQDTITMNLIIENKRTDAVCWLKDYTVTYTETWESAELEISGVFYNSDQGYVVLSTEEPFVYSRWDDWPAKGVLVVTGDTGIAGGSTKARLTALSSTTYEVEADTDGDGVYDWESGVLYWSDL